MLPCLRGLGNSLSLCTVVLLLITVGLILNLLSFTGSVVTADALVVIKHLDLDCRTTSGGVVTA